MDRGKQMEQNYHNINIFFFTYMPPTIAEKIAVKAFPPSVCPFQMKTPAYQNTRAQDMHAIP